MTEGQTRVAVLLVLLLAFEAIKQPPVKATIANIINGSAQQLPVGQWNINGKLIIYWLVGAVALVALASPAPDIATMLAVILLALVVLSDITDFTALLTPPTSKKKQGGQS